MFGRKKKDEGGSGAKGADPAAGYFARRKVDIDQRFALQQAGVGRASAIVSSATMTFELPRSEFDDDLGGLLHPEQEWSIQASVTAADGSTFPATFALYLDELLQPPTIGATMYVLVDPNDPGRILADELWDPAMPGNQPGFGHDPIRWKVPAECPNCGAPVDQSTESMAEHPTCHMCHQPLPCEPMA